MVESTDIENRQHLCGVKNMKKILNRMIAGIVLTLGCSVAASAAVVFQDNFDTENGGAGLLNYNSFSNWTVSDGTVDLIGNGFFDFFPTSGLFVDMDGSTGDAGKITSVAIALAPGDYALSYDLAGNQRNAGNEQVVVEVGSVSVSHSLTQNVPLTTFIQNFSLGVATVVNISFEGIGNPGDNIGMILDNVVLESRGAVPEPGTVLLMVISLLGLGVVRRRLS